MTTNSINCCSKHQRTKISKYCSFLKITNLLDVSRHIIVHTTVGIH